MAYEFIRYDVAEHVATLTLARPDKMNAINGAMVREMIAAFQAADADDDVRAVIVTGEGRAFCAGPICRAARTALSRRGARRWSMRMAR